MPRHLHGRTQHKTLGARLAEEILEKGDRSLFYRNAPGRYFLSEFLTDPAVDPTFRRRFIARRRRRQLAQPKPLAVDRINLTASAPTIVPIETILGLITRGDYHYPLSTKTATQRDVCVWSFVVVARGPLVLTYRHGQYREDRDAFRQRRAIGFYAPVLEGDRTLFDLDDHGIVRRGLTTISIDLGMTTSVALATLGEALATLDCFVLHEHEGTSTLLSVIRFEAPDWFEPYARRLAINDLRWIDVGKPINHSEDFDPWSAAVIAATAERESTPTARHREARG